MLFLSSAGFFQNQLFEKILSEIHVPSKCQKGWTLIKVQIVCQAYQQTTLIDKQLSQKLPLRRFISASLTLRYERHVYPGKT